MKAFNSLTVAQTKPGEGPGCSEVQWEMSTFCSQ